MRTIKFRAWDKTTKQMLIIHELRWSIDGIFLGGGDTWFADGIFAPAEKWSKEVMQFTGLTDKNGKEIYEGDIVIDVSDFLQNQKRIGAIIWHDSAFYKHTKIIEEEAVSYIEPFPFSKDSAKDSKVIGNIYENPNLLI